MQRQRIIIIGSMVTAVGVLAVGARRPAVPRAETRTEEASQAAAMLPPAPRALGAVEARHEQAATVRPVQPQSRADALRRGLASDSAATRIAAIEAVVMSTALEALPVLQDFDLKRDPEAAPTVIHAVAILGGSGDDATRDRAARTLSSWLRTERSREGLDALGNVSNLIEALGNVGGPDAVEALSAALDRGDLGLHVETLATMKLAELGDHRARAAIQRFAARAEALPPTDGLPEELRVEAIAAAHNALATL